MSEINDSTNNNYFLLSWCETGIERIIDITDDYFDDTDLAMAKLAGENPRNTELQRLIDGLLLRARYNSDRSYEVYGLRTDKAVDLDTLEYWADSDPQNFVDIVRSHGVALHKKEPALKRVIQ